MSRRKRYPERFRRLDEERQKEIQEARRVIVAAGGCDRCGASEGGVHDACCYNNIVEEPVDADREQP